MQSNAHIAVRQRPSRLQIVLAAAWMILSLAIGGAVSAGTSADEAAAPAITRTATP